MAEIMAETMVMNNEQLSRVMKAEIAEAMRGFDSDTISDKVAAKMAKPAPEVAKLEAGMMAGIKKMEIFDIPVAQVLGGGFVAIVASELVDGFLLAQTKQVKGIVKGIGAIGFAKFGRKIPVVGGMAGTIALLLAFDAARDLLPIDEWGAQIATRITGMLPQAGLAGPQNLTPEQMRKLTDVKARTTGVGHYSGIVGRMG